MQMKESRAIAPRLVGKARRAATFALLFRGVAPGLSHVGGSIGVASF